MVTVRDMLMGQGLNVPDSDINAGPLHEKHSDFCIAMYYITSQAPQSFFNSDETWQYPEIQIRVRAPQGMYAEGEEDARQIWDIMTNGRPPDYLITKTTKSSPFYLDADAEDRHHWTVDTQLQIIS
jgi:hypothetical protein